MSPNDTGQSGADRETPLSGEGPIASEMRARLEAALSPAELVIVDDSESHRGHSGFQEGGESHFNVRIRAAAFEGQNRLARHRAVHAALGPELVSRIHALALDLDSA